MAEVWTPPNLDDIAASELVTHTYLNQLGNSLRFLSEKNYTSFTGDVSVTATTVGTANQIVSSGALTYEAVPHWIYFFVPRVDVGVAVCNIIIRDSTTVLGTLSNAAANATLTPYWGAFRVTPTAASHTYNVAAWNASAATSTFRAGSGGTAGDSTTRVAGFIQVFRQPT